MKFLLLSVLTALLMIMGGFFADYALGETQTVPASDFAIAVQAGLQSLATNPEEQSREQQIQNQDYKSSWDEFGVNTLVDGSAPAREIDNQITKDIIQSIQASQSYNQQEANYLQAMQITPEQIQSSEISVGIDAPPNQSIDPNPSINANPDVNISPVDVPIENPAGNANSSVNMENTSSAESFSAPTSTNEINTTMPGSGNSAPETSSSTADIASSTQDINSFIPDVNTSSTTTSASSNESLIYDAILQGEQTHPADQTATSSDNGANSSSPADN